MGDACRHQRLEDGQILAGLVIADKQEVFPTQRNQSQIPLTKVVVQADLRVVEEDTQCLALLETLPNGPSNRTLGRMQRLLGVQPREDLGDNRRTPGALGRLLSNATRTASKWHCPRDPPR